MSASNRKSLPISYALFLCASVAVYSLSGLFVKLASGYGFMSMPYLLCLFGAVFVLGLYAIMWQMALKRVKLSLAYMFRSLGAIYSLLIAYFVFNEQITVCNMLGCALVVAGILILLGGQGEKVKS